MAVGAVIGFHYYHWPVFGNAGVELFFVLSGFLITTLLVEEWQKFGRIGLGRFYLRRALRLFPALWVFLAVFGIVAHFSRVPRYLFLEPAIYGLTYTTNIFAATGSDVGWLPHLWSLATEEQFYLLWPLLLIVMLRRRLRLGAIVMIAAVLAAVVIVLRDVYVSGHLGYSSLAYFKFDAILIGCIAGLLFTSRHRRSLARFCCAPPVAAVAAVSLVYLLIRPPALLSVRIGDVSWFAYWPLFNLSAAVTIIWVVERCPRFAPARWLLESPPVGYVGRISYALYLWHPFVLDWLRWPHGGNIQDSERILRPLALAGTLIAASASYWLVERPFLRMKWRLSATGSHDADASVILRHDYEGESGPERPAGAS